MRLLADENVPAEVVALLRNNGHDVSWMRTIAPGTGDVAILALAQQEQRTILTFDKDFGDLTFRAKLPARAGVILVRFAMYNPDAAANAIVSALQSRDHWEGLFSVIEQYRIRSTPLPEDR